jgi:Saxitoxin biosynthesis operon protein SxtJ
MGSGVDASEPPGRDTDDGGTRPRTGFRGEPAFRDTMKAIKQFFSLIWRGWMKFAHALGWIQARILLTVSYFVVIAIAWIVTRITRSDLLDRKLTPGPTFYRAREPYRDTLETCRRQF